MLKESSPRSGKPRTRAPNRAVVQRMILQYLRCLFIRISLISVFAGSLAPGIKGSSSPQFTSSHFSLGTESKAVSLLRSAQIFAFSSASTRRIEVLHNSTKDAGFIHNGRHSNTKMYILPHICINTRTRFCYASLLQLLVMHLRPEHKALRKYLITSELLKSSKHV